MQTPLRSIATATQTRVASERETRKHIERRCLLSAFVRCCNKHLFVLFAACSSSGSSSDVSPAAAQSELWPSPGSARLGSARLKANPGKARRAQPEPKPHDAERPSRTSERPSEQAGDHSSIDCQSAV